MYVYICYCECGSWDGGRKFVLLIGCIVVNPSNCGENLDLHTSWLSVATVVISLPLAVDGSMHGFYFLAVKRQLGYFIQIIASCYALCL